MEFDEARPYQPGDDIRSIDWRVTARTGKTHTKLYREERERPVLICLDLRKPMFFASQQMYKSVLAAKTAALLAWSSSQHNDRLGGLVFSESQHCELRPQRGKSATLHFLKRITEHRAWEDNNHTEPSPRAGSNNTVNQALDRLRRVAKPGSLIFLISDFRNINQHTESTLAKMSRHNDLIMIFISDPLEQQLPPAGYYKLSNGVDEITINTANKIGREYYQQRFAAHQQYLKDCCKKFGIFFISVSTHQPLLGALQQGLGLSNKKR